MQSNIANKNPVFLRNRYFVHRATHKTSHHHYAITNDLISDYDNEGELVAITLDNYFQSNCRLITQE